MTDSRWTEPTLGLGSAICDTATLRPSGRPDRVRETTTDISSVNQDVSTLQEDFTALQSAQAALPSDRDNALTATDVNSAIAAANVAIDAAVAKTNGFIAEAHSVVTLAYNEAIAAAQAEGCLPQAQPSTTVTTVAGKQEVGPDLLSWNSRR